MIDDETRRQIADEDRDWIKEYADAIEHHTEAALDGNAKSIKWVKCHLKDWVEGTSQRTPSLEFLRVAAAHFMGSAALLPVPRAQEYDLPKELDAANIAYQAVCNGYGDQSAPFAERIKQFLRENWPAGTFTDESIKRIGIVANQDTKTGPKRRRAT